MQAHKVCVLKEAHQIHFCSFVQSSQSICLESQALLDVIGDFLDESGERQLQDQVVSPLLVVPDLVEGVGSRPKLGRSLALLLGDGSSSGLLCGVPRLLASSSGCLKNENEHLHYIQWRFSVASHKYQKEYKCHQYTAMRMEIQQVANIEKSTNVINTQL